jgi:hypothetical protein
MTKSHSLSSAQSELKTCKSLLNAKLSKEGSRQNSVLHCKNNDSRGYHHLNEKLRVKTVGNT